MPSASKEEEPRLSIEAPIRNGKSRPTDLLRVYAFWRRRKQENYPERTAANINGVISQHFQKLAAISQNNQCGKSLTFNMHIEQVREKLPLIGEE